ncbi:MAG: hypothetical protein QME73_08570 [Bacillota bacterium]|nr:hypothetical protein [Bacillota bacterium]
MCIKWAGGEMREKRSGKPYAGGGEIGARHGYGGGIGVLRKTIGRLLDSVLRFFSHSYGTNRWYML